MSGRWRSSDFAGVAILRVESNRGAYTAEVYNGSGRWLTGPRLENPGERDSRLLSGKQNLRKNTLTFLYLLG